MIRSLAGSHYCTKQAFDQFFNATLCLDGTEPLLRAACAIAQHAFEDQSYAQFDAQIQQLSLRVMDKASNHGAFSAKQRMAALHQVLFDEEGFVGATSQAPIHHFLPLVLELKSGSAEALSLIYRAVAERLHLQVDAIRLPKRFCVRVRLHHDVLHVDPFRGRMMTEEESWQAILDSRLPGCGVVTNPMWLRLMLRNLQAVLAANGRMDDLEAVAELQTVLAHASMLGESALAE